LLARKQNLAKKKYNALKDKLARGKKMGKRKLWAPFLILSFSPFSSLGPILCGFGRKKSKKQGKTFLKKYKEYDLETQIATHTKQDT
jgi:hypothetical protein